MVCCVAVQSSLAISSFPEAAAKPQVVRDVKDVKACFFCSRFCLLIADVISLKVTSSSLHGSIDVRLFWAPGERKLLALDIMF